MRGDCKNVMPMHPDFYKRSEVKGVGAGGATRIFVLILQCIFRHPKARSELL
jgi:hypothetical protein